MTDTVHVTRWNDAGTSTDRAVFIHGSQSWGTDDVAGFLAQRPLARTVCLDLIDRRGYGDSPDTSRSDYDHDADDAIAVLGDGAHLVGHSYGAVVALLAAARAPHRVRSLALIEPGAYAMAAEDAAVADALARQRAGLASMPADLTAEQFLWASSAGVGLTPPAPTPARLRAAATAMRERPCTEAEIPVAALRDAPYPKLVITGDWTSAPDLYRELGGKPLRACARIIARKIGARLAEVRDADHFPHVQQPHRVNTELAQLWHPTTTHHPL